MHLSNGTVPSLNMLSGAFHGTVPLCLTNVDFNRNLSITIIKANVP
jgi:hypothetical protein